MTSDTITITTRLGNVRGLDIGMVKSYLGLRYGKSTAGSRRFLPPIAADSWSGTYDATRFPNRAIQQKPMDNFWPPVAGEMDEDCLFLNVVTPDTGGKKRPVLFWIHGGGFATGSANEYDGSVLAAQGDVVVVSVNFRLGPLGFLDLSMHGPEYQHSGANGILDIILALEWVRDNIQDYGGDPDNVTIFGESSGGTTVMSLLATPAADLLYHKAIGHSATWVFRKPTDRTDSISKRLGVSPDDYLEKLLTMPAQELADLKLPVGVCVDGTVITRSTLQAITDRGAAGVPLLTGTNLREGTLYTKGSDADKDHYTNFNNGLAKEMLQGKNPDAFIAALQEAYPDLTPGKLHEMMWTDMFRGICVQAAEAASVAGAGGWLYRFDLPANLPQFEPLGATHSAELAFTFNSFANPDTHAKQYHDREDPIVRRVAKTWSDTIVRFAKTGQPNGGDLPDWPQYEPKHRHCLVINTDFMIESDPDKLHRSLWSAESSDR